MRVFFGRSFLSCALLACGLFPGYSAYGQFAGAEPVAAEVEKGFATITEERSEELLSILVGKGFDGRGTGQEGYARAAHFVAGKLAQYGFQPVGDDGTYFQYLPYARVAVDSEASSLKIGDLELRGAKQLSFRDTYRSKRSEAKVTVITGKSPIPNLTEPEKLAGQVIILVGDDLPQRYAQQLARFDVAGVFRLVDAPSKSEGTVVYGQDPRRNSDRAFGEIAVEDKAALAKALGIDVAKLTPRTDSGVEVIPTEANAVVDVKATEEKVLVANVVGWLPGTDSEVGHEHVVIGAHLDHLGTQNGTLYPGADDNGSGSTSILQIAEAIHANPVKPKRGVLYIAFAAEELGLIGSKFYCDHPIKPLEDAVCMLNVDMIGRNEEQEGEKAEENIDSIHWVGAKEIPEALNADITEANKHVGFRFEYDEDRVYRRSDHYNFAAKGVPSTFVFGGFNPYYHQPTDNLDGINFEKIANVARLNYLVLMKAAEHGHYRVKPAPEAAK